MKNRIRPFISQKLSVSQGYRIEQLNGYVPGGWAIFGVGATGKALRAGHVVRASEAADPVEGTEETANEGRESVHARDTSRFGVSMGQQQSRVMVDRKIPDPPQGAAQ